MKSYLTRLFAGRQLQLKLKLQLKLQLPTCNLPGNSTATVPARHAAAQETRRAVELPVLDARLLIPAAVLSTASMVEASSSCACSAMEGVRICLRASMVAKSLVSDWELCRILGRSLYGDIVVLREAPGEKLGILSALPWMSSTSR